MDCDLGIYLGIWLRTGYAETVDLCALQVPDSTPVSASAQAPVKANKISGVSVKPAVLRVFRLWQLHLQHAELAQAEIVETYSEQILLPLNR
ncbi:hypothetical protein D3C80_1624480 [compost metagenome]